MEIARQMEVKQSVTQPVQPNGSSSWSSRLPWWRSAPADQVQAPADQVQAPVAQVQVHEDTFYDASGDVGGRARKKRTRSFVR